MRFEQNTVNQVIHVVTDRMVCYLPCHIVEHLTCVYEFNGMLVRVLNFLEVDFRAQHRPLSLQAILCNYSIQHEMPITNENKETETNIKEQELEWINTGRVFWHK